MPTASTSWAALPSSAETCRRLNRTSSRRLSGRPHSQSRTLRWHRYSRGWAVSRRRSCAWRGLRSRCPPSHPLGPPPP